MPGTVVQATTGEVFSAVEVALKGSCRIDTTRAIAEEDQRIPAVSARRIVRQVSSFWLTMTLVGLVVEVWNQPSMASA